MEILEAMEKRHSVRQYIDKEIDKETAEKLRTEIEKVNLDSGLDFQLKLNEPGCFTGVMAKYGSFAGVKNYIVAAGPKNMDREIGYYGEKIVIRAQMLGLNTCWVALTYNKRKTLYTLRENDKFYLVISLGYGKTQGNTRKSKKSPEVSNVGENSPEWFVKGVETALNAPTAINQQRFYFNLNDDGTVTGSAPRGKYTEMDLGIAMYHFDAGSGKNNFNMAGGL